MDRLKEFIEENIYRIIIGFIITLILLFMGLFVLISNNINSESNHSNNQSIISTDTNDQASNNSISVESTSEPMFVDIKGAVKHPGVYQISSNMRVIDVVHLAGELSKSADRKHLNLSQRVNDQQMIYIPLKGEIKESQEIDLNVLSPSSNDSSSSNSKININTADKSALQQISGIGDKKADKIIDYRENNRRFQKIEDIKEVSGFGEKSFESIKNDITV